MCLNKEIAMHPKTITVISAGLAAAMMMLPQAASALGGQEGMRKADGPQAVTPLSPPRLERKIRGPRDGDLEIAPGFMPQPVITDPVFTSDMCCVEQFGSKVRASSSFHVHGEGVPGNLVKVAVHLENGGSRSLVGDMRATVGEDGLWRTGRVEVSSDDLKSPASIELNVSQVFPATRVHEPDKEVAGQPVSLTYRMPLSRNGGSVGTSTTSP